MGKSPEQRLRTVVLTDREIDWITAALLRAMPVVETPAYRVGLVLQMDQVYAAELSLSIEEMKSLCERLSSAE